MPKIASIRAVDEKFDGKGGPVGLPCFVVGVNAGCGQRGGGRLNLREPYFLPATRPQNAHSQRHPFNIS